jgi:hypothetical protein
VVRQYSNTAVETTLAAPIDASVTSIVVASASGFPISYPYRLTIDFEAPANEIVDVTAAAGTTLTVIRGADGSSAQAHSTGAMVVHTATAQDFRDIQNHVTASTGVHGLIAGVAVVGTSTTQTLTNKTLDGSANTFTNINAGAITGNFKSTTIVATNATTVALTVRGFTSQSARLQNWQDPGANTVAYVDQLGNASFDSITTVDGGLVTSEGGNSVFTGKTVDLTALLPTAVPLQVKMAPAATADPFRILNSVDVPVFRVAPGGGITANSKSTMTQAVINQTGAVDPVLQLKAQPAVTNTKPYLEVVNHLDVSISRIDQSGFWIGPADTTSLAGTFPIPSLPGNSTKIPYTAVSEEWDTRARHNTPVDRILLPVAGFYLVTCQAIFPFDATGTRGSDVRLNSSAVFPLVNRVNPVGGGFPTYVGSTKVLKLAANDYLEHFVYQNAGPSLNVTAHFQVTFLGT